MKKNHFMLYVLLVFNISVLQAQELTVATTVHIDEDVNSLFTQTGHETFVCAYPDVVEPDQRGLYSYSTDTSILEQSEVVVFNIYFWNLNPVSGSNTNPFVEDKALAIVSELNNTFQSLSVFFKYRGVGNYVSSNHFISENAMDLHEEAQDLGFYKENAFNVYVPKALTYACGSGSTNSNIVTLGGSCITPSRVVHEIAHNFGLSHTHANWRTPGILCERVTRNTLDPLYNADRAGDFVSDTAAAPNFLIEHLMELKDDGITDPAVLSNYIRHKYIDPETCQYNNPNGVGFSDQVPYQIFEQDVTNYMSYTFDSCRASFTPGQRVKMRETIDVDILNIFGNITTSVAALYEPYTGSYYLAGPQNTDDKPLFQPGFDYTFYDCSGNFFDAPSHYDENFSFTVRIVSQINSNETDYETITHPNHSAIQIRQVDSAQGWSQVKKCYDNYNLSPIGGLVMRFEDGILNQNVSVFPIDANGIIDANLSVSLERGLYKIEKHYQDGSKFEKVLYKGYE